MKKIFKRGMSGLLAVLMAFTVLAGFGTTTAFAASETAESYMISFPRDGDAAQIYSEDAWGHSAKNYMNGWATGSSNYTTLHCMDSFDGKVCYCIEPGLSRNVGDTYHGFGEDFWDNYPSQYNNTIEPDDIKLLLGRIMQYGYQGNLSTSWRSQNDSDADKLAHAFATQLLVWETVVGERDADFDHVSTGGYDEILSLVSPNHPLYSRIMDYYGGVAGANIFAAQYIGNNDNKNAQHAIRFNFIMVTCFSALFIAVMYLFQDKLISAFLHISSGKGDLQATLQYGKEYLKIMLWQVLPFALATTYAMTLRLGKDSMTPMKASFAALFTNLIFNYLLIFGKLGFPRLGVAGAAIATVISRIVQLGIISVAAHRNTDRFPFLKGLFRSLYIPGELTWSIVLRGLPLLFNQLLLSAGQVLMNQIYSNRGLEAVASMNIVTTVANLFVVIMWSFGNYIAIYTGNLLGNREFDKARGECPKLMALSFVCCIAGSILLAAISGLIPRLYNVLPLVRTQATQMLLITAVAIPIQSLSISTMFLLRAGGMTRITSLFDCGSTWLLFIPAAWLLVKFTAFTLPVVYLLVNCLELVKAGIGIVLSAKGVWVNNIISVGANKT